MQQPGLDLCLPSWPHFLLPFPPVTPIQPNLFSLCSSNSPRLFPSKSAFLQSVCLVQFPYAYPCLNFTGLASLIHRGPPRLSLQTNLSRISRTPFWDLACMQTTLVSCFFSSGASTYFSFYLQHHYLSASSTINCKSINCSSKWTNTTWSLHDPDCECGFSPGIKG